MIDTVYVDNAADAHLQAADALSPQSAVAGQAYFISQGEPVNYWNWINDIIRMAGLAPVEKAISLRAAWQIGVLLESAHWLLHIRTEPRMTRFLAAQLGRSHYFDIQKARNDFGYTPKISNDDGMKMLAAALQSGQFDSSES